MMIPFEKASPDGDPLYVGAQTLIRPLSQRERWQRGCGVAATAPSQRPPRQGRG
jgi:hypothetical protein